MRLPWYNVTIADPAGNITALIEAAGESPAAWTDEERQHIVRRVMREHPQVEQSGFVIPGSTETGRLWRLEMAGGEFCGNAARSFGLFVARKQNMHSPATVHVTLSGAEKPLAVLADLQNNTAEVELPVPCATRILTYQGEPLPVIVFDGITHVIMEETGKNRDEAALTKTFFALKTLVETGTEPPAALGVLFYDSARAFLRPAVLVYGTYAGVCRGIETFVFENSCGSGSAALACHHARHSPDGEYRQTYQQPGGAIATRLVKKNGKTVSLFIGGPVSFR
jgi:diaminopimelate epimerase